MKSIKHSLFFLVVFYNGSVLVEAQTAAISVLVPNTSSPETFSNNTPLPNITTDYGYHLFAVGATGGPADFSIFNNRDAGNGSPTGSIGSFLNLTESLISLTRQNPTGIKSSGILLELTGGAGGFADGIDNDVSGGYAGNSGFITAMNQGLLNATGQFGGGLTLFQGRTTGGQGGGTRVDPGRAESGDGRPGGDAGEISLTNSAALTIGTISSAVSGAGSFEGIFAQSAGGNAGTGARGAGGGRGNKVTLINSGVIELNLQSISPSNPLASAYGILGTSTGGNGTDSFETKATAGLGGTGLGVDLLLNQGGNISLNYDGSNSAMSNLTGAGLGAFTRGGQGGVAWNGDNGGYGTGGAGGYAGPVNVTSKDADIRVSGPGIGGIIASSTGGEGGGGTDNQKSSSGNGATAGAVTVNFSQTTGNLRQLSTNGTNAIAITAKTVSGDGGSSPTSNQAAGGNGGNGGFGGTATMVNVALDGSVLASTTGTLSHGIFASAKGGNGGHGAGLNITFTSGINPTSGNGGNGGSTEAVEVNLLNGAAISTLGNQSIGVVAVTAGGNGGTGGLLKASFNLLGGTAGNGGNGGSAGAVTVSVNPNSSINTAGVDSSAIVAQSKSGTGAVGGGTDTTFTGQSGAGGRSGNTGAITVNNAGELLTTGNDAYGIFAQASVGAGGASGEGLSVISNTIASPGSNGSVGDININNSGSITTGGEYAYGILAQSLSGPGGASGSTGTGNLFSSIPSGASSAPGGNISLNQSGMITTGGLFSHGALLQSLGGGGGDGGSDKGLIAVGGNSGSGGTGGAVSASLTSGSFNTKGGNSNALLAQSIGGSGGNAGNAQGLGIGVALAIGGNGGSGGNGGLVNITSSSDLSTAASKSNGILAQSVGGGGGNGGAATSLSVAPLISIGVAIGGKGASGQIGGPVNVATTGGIIWTGQNAASVTTLSNTLPSDAIGILAQSIGGGGGNGGTSSASAVGISLPIPSEAVPQVALSISSSIGGIGGKGGNGNTSLVNIQNGTQIITQGQGSHGILNQSIGGGGGNGGDSSAAATTIGYGRVASQVEQNSLAIDISFSLGGNGAAGGNGGTANTTLGGTGAASGLTTFGDFSNGLIAQSIGGGGGNAGFGSATSEAYGAAGTIAASIGLGGDGGSGGNGGNAETHLLSGNTLESYGAGSHGLVAQSIGGGGGISQGSAIGLSAEYAIPVATHGGELPEEPADRPHFGELALGASLELNLGATGGSGGDGGTVSSSINGKILTHGNDASAVVVQSIGGGGGLAGGAGSEASADEQEGPDINGVLATVRADISLISYGILPEEFEAELNLGSFDAGASGKGGNVSVSGQGQISTDGDWSHGILAQSIGGGGGKADSAVGVESEALMKLGFNIGGLGKRILGVSTGQRTEANTATSADGGVVSAQFDGLSIRTGAENNGRGLGAMGIILQSIGGGGGIAVDGSALATGGISVGNSKTEESDGNVTGNGGQVYAYGSAIISTTGEGAHGFVAQSIGAGGGIGGAGSSVQVVDGDGNDLNSSVDVRVGGNSYSTGRGSAVHLGDDSIDTLIHLDITTTGTSAYGILAQSIGGGGGLAAVMDPSSSSVAGTDSGAAGGDRNSGSVVDIYLDGQSRIATQGIGAHGIVAQSIGAGGGIAGYRSDGAFSISQLPGNLYAYGNAGGIEMYLADGSSITTTGARAHGILAQSIGGMGGLFDGQAGRYNRFGTGSGKNIYLNVSGDIAVSGAGSYGVFSQIDGATQDITLGTQLNVYGSVSSHGTAVYLSGGKNTVTIHPDGAISGRTAIQNDSPLPGVINNNGTVSGDILTGPPLVASSSENSFLVLPTPALQLHNAGTYYAGSRIEADVVNEGEIYIGRHAPGTANQRTTLTGSLTQTRDGVLLVNTDFTRQSGPLLTVTGDANLAGKVRPIFSQILPNQEIQILEVNGTLTNRLQLNPDVDHSISKIFKFGLRQDQQKIFIRTAGADFTPNDQSFVRNAAASADYLDALWAAEDNAKLGGLFASLDSLSLGSNKAYKSALLQLSPGATLGFAARGIASHQAFGNTALEGQKFEGGSAKPVEIQSFWARSYGSHSNHEVPGDAVHDYNVDTSVAAAGGQWKVGPSLFLGGSLGYQYDSFHSDSGHTSGDVDSVLGAFTAKYERDDWLFAAAITGSAGWMDTTRRIAIPDNEVKTEGSPNLQSFGLLARAAYTFHNGIGYLRPKIDANLVYLHADSYSETGAGNLDLRVASEDQTTFIFTPGFETGFRTNLDNGLVLRTYFSGGVSVQTSDEWQQSSRLANGPSEAGEFTTALPHDQMSVRVILGCQVQFTDNLSGYIQYEGELSKNVTHNGGGLGIKVEF